MIGTTRRKKDTIIPIWAVVIFAIIIITTVVMNVVQRINKDKPEADYINSLGRDLNSLRQSFAENNKMLQNFFERQTQASSSAVIQEPELDSKGKYIRSAQLLNATQKTSAGSVINTQNRNMFQYDIVVQLPDVFPGFYYEGWLLQDEGVSYSLSLGRLTKDINGQYILDFSSSLDYKDYKKAAITLEQEDNNPDIGTIVLEGVFQ